MSGEIVGVAVMALLFVGFGLLRPAERGEGGCHGCSGGGESGECGASCPLLQDLERTLNEPESQHERA